jgi:hypothetical protein
MAVVYWLRMQNYEDMFADVCCTSVPTGVILEIAWCFVKKYSDLMTTSPFSAW